MGIFHSMTEFIMSEFVFAPHAITRHGEWVTPLTAAQEDYDILFCEYCRLKISVVIDELTGVKSFVHTPLRLEAAKLLTTCSYSKTASKLVEGKRRTNQTLHSQLAAIRPERTRLLACKTTKQNWRCCWCHICWHGEKVCPQCEDWIYAITCSD
ncbi:TPA: hypothetical protein SK276_001219 [Yersinia enterocolitica]|nr:hypothetical protein [Yersinia enterocolitica]EKN3937696.1 hypothetical protein [Yersinia enterocolitica]EKN4872258.1 hypothetical protein [Yersinia enterocolitica]EKN5028257.1 hypothetical protein [Yersinia enterocolitica]EKN6328078.1 hypothetical protein [Yersinia enterocolitica]